MQPFPEADARWRSAVERNGLIGDVAADAVHRRKWATLSGPDA
jgi:hypothetical protein